MTTQIAHDPTSFDDDRPESAPARTQFRVMTPVVRYERGGRGEGKPRTYWHHVGMAWENPPTETRARSISIKLNSLPMTSELVLFVDEGRPEDRSGDGSDRT